MDESGDPAQLLTLSILKPFEPEAAIELVLLILLLLCSALISGSEVAFFSLNSKDAEDLKQSDKREDSTILMLLQKPKKLLATILIANNFINVAIVILSSLIINTLFDFTTSPLFGLIFQLVIVTFLILLVGEIVPKVYATNHTFKLLHKMVHPINILNKFFSPLSYLLTSFTKIIDKRIIKKSDNISVDELSHALELTKDETVDEEDHKILKGIVKFGNTSVKQVMTSRVDVVALENTEKFPTVVDVILNSGYSRIPVFEENFDNVIGVLYIKDLLPHLDKSKNLNWLTLLRPAFFVPENKKIDDLLKEFQEKKIHMAVVVDEYGGSSGLISLEDIIEEIVGEISDEFDDEDLVYSKLDDHNYIFQGKILLNDFYRVLAIDGDEFEKEKGDSDTLAGFVLEIHGKIPQKGDTIAFEQYLFKVESADNRKINTLKLTIENYGLNQDEKFEE